MSPAAIKVTPQLARDFQRRVHLLDTPAADIATAIGHHGYIQIDPINVCGRMHDLILRNRVTGYREGDLMRHLHGPATAPAPLPAPARTAFEHHLPATGILVALPLEAWPHLQAAMHARRRHTGAWSGRLTPREREFATVVLAEIAARGPLGAEDLADSRRVRRGGWGKATLAKNTLQKLFFHGRLLIAQRVNQRRRYDLPERVLPAGILSQPPASAADTARWLALLKVRQRRLTTLKREELRAVSDAVQRIDVEGCPPLFCLRKDVSVLEAAPRPPGPGTTRLLAPLDPLIYDRTVTAALWNFDYTWEAYTPPAKRVRGYYALPVLAGAELVGHVDPKSDRAQKKLTVVSRRVRRGYPVTASLRELAEFLGLRH